MATIPSKHYQLLKKRHPGYMDAMEALGKAIKSEGPLDEKTTQLIIVKGLLHQQRNLEQRKIYPFIVKSLFAQKADNADQHDIAEQNKSRPAEQWSQPGIPGDIIQDLQPPHLPAAGQPVSGLSRSGKKTAEARLCRAGPE